MFLLKTYAFFSALAVFTDARGEGCFHPGKRAHVLESISTNLTVDNVYPIGTNITYSCYPGYTLVYNDKRVCLDDGTWAGMDPYCGINVAETASIYDTVSKHTLDVQSDLQRVLNSTCLPTITTEAHPSTIWYIHLKKRHTVDLLEVTFPPSSNAISRPPEIHFSGDDFTNQSPLFTRLNHTKRYEKKIAQAVYLVVVYAIQQPMSSQYAIFKLEWPYYSLVWCNLRLYASLDLSNSLCDFSGNTHLRHFYINNKCYAVFPNEEVSNWHVANEQCENFKRNSSSLIKLDSDYRTTLKDLFDSIKQTISLNDVRGENYWVDFQNQQFRTITFKSDADFSLLDRLTWEVRYSRICEYDLPGCGSPDQKAFSLMTYNEQHAFYSCPKDFQISGSDVRECSSGRWSSPAPECVSKNRLDEVITREDGTKRPVVAEPACNKLCNNSDKDSFRNIIDTIIIVVVSIVTVQWIATGVAYVYITKYHH